MAAFADLIQNEFEVRRRLMESSTQYARERIDGLKSDLQSLMVDYQKAIQSMGAETAILKRVMAQCLSIVLDALPKERVPQPKGFRGARNAKELENFLWNIE